MVLVDILCGGVIIIPAAHRPVPGQQADMIAGSCIHPLELNAGACFGYV
jgi:hypothetical protein